MRLLKIVMLSAFFALLLGCVSHKPRLYKMSWFGDAKYQEGWTTAMLDSIGMKSVAHTNNSFYFRYSESTQAVDLWSDDMIKFHGKVFCVTHSNNNKKQRYFGMPFDLPDSTANRIAKVYFDLKVDAIPDGDSLYGSWVKDVDIADGFSCRFESKNKNRFYEKTYRYLTGKDSIKEFKIIDSFCAYISSASGMYYKYDLFKYRLPPGVYSQGMLEFVVPYGGF